MQQNSILLQNLSTDQLEYLIGNVFDTKFKDFQNNFNNPNPDVLMTREQTCDFLQIDSSTLWHWTNKGKVIAYGIGNRRYYKKAELLECLIQLKK